MVGAKVDGHDPAFVKTILVLQELYPTKEALDAAGTGAADALIETFGQLDELLVTLGAAG